MEPLLGKLKFTNNTPYHISYKKGPKIPKGFTFEVEDELILGEIEIWYGGKWSHKSNIQVEDNSIVYKQFIPPQQESLSGLAVGLTTSSKSDSVFDKLFKKIF